MKKELIEKLFGRLSEVEKKRAIVFVKGKTYTWEEAVNIIRKDENSDLAKEIIKKIEEIVE